MNRVVDGVVVAALELPDGNHHIQFVCAQPDECGGFLAEVETSEAQREIQ